MLPQNHFIIAGLTISPVALAVFPEKSLMTVGEWVLVGGLLSSAIDLDVYALVLLKSKENDRLKPYRNPVEIFRKFRPFMETITDTGVLRNALKIHVISSALMIFLCSLFSHTYILPVTLGVVSHLISDIPNLRRLFR